MRKGTEILVYIKNLQPGNRFSLICFLLIFATCIVSAVLNLILRFSGGNPGDGIMVFNTLIAIPASFAYLLLFIIPGLLVAQIIIEKEYIQRKYLLLVSVTLSSLLAYSAFWVYYFNHIAGRVVSIIIILSCIIVFFRRFKSLKGYFFEPLFIKPLTICFIVGCLYSGILLLYGGAQGDISAIVNNRFLLNLPSDNVIPRMVFEMAYNGLPLYMLDDYWFVSDRPPIATAITLLLYPLNIFIANPSYMHQLFGTYVQLLWIPVLYYLCDFFSLSSRVRNYVIACAVFSGVFIMNSVFVWPKYSTTIYFCLVLLLTFDLANEKKNTKKAAVYSVMIGIATAMAFLSHGIVLFSFLALGLAIIVCEKRFKYNYRDLVYAFGSFIVIYIPWHLFSRSIDPSGNKLLKIGFAGPGREHLSLTEGIVEYYTQTPIDSIFTQKFVNFFDMFVTDIWQYAYLENIRLFSFNKTFGITNFLNIFLIIAALYFLYRYCFKKKLLSYKQRIILWFSIFSFTIWPLLMNDGAIIFQGSYFNLILVYFLIAFGVKHSNKFITTLLFIVNILIFIAAFVFHRDIPLSQSASYISMSMLILALLSAAAFFVYLYVFDTDDVCNSSESIQEI